MEIIKLILLFILCLGVLAMAFFLMCIWRSVLGKTAIDFQLGRTVDLMGKEVEKNTTAQHHNMTTSNELRSQIRDLTRIMEKVHKQRERDADK